MKLVQLTIIALISTIGIFAFSETKTIPSLEIEKTKIDVYRVADAIVLGSNLEKDINVRLISWYKGQSTDVSPKKYLYITYFHGSEQNNTKTSFALDPVMELKSTRKIAPGIYEISVVDTQLKFKTIKIDTTQVFIDDQNLKPAEFESPYFKSTIEVTE